MSILSTEELNIIKEFIKQNDYEIKETLKKIVTIVTSNSLGSYVFLRVMDYINTTETFAIQNSQVENILTIKKIYELLLKDQYNEALANAYKPTFFNPVFNSVLDISRQVNKEIAKATYPENPEIAGAFDYEVSLDEMRFKTVAKTAEIALKRKLIDLQDEDKAENTEQSKVTKLSK